MTRAPTSRQTTRTLTDAYRAKTPGSAAQWGRAQRRLPTGISRNAVLRRPYPIFFSSANAQLLHDIDGNAYVDYCLNFGPILLGHGVAAIVDPVLDQVRRGWGYGGPTNLELDVAAMIGEMYPAAERVRFLSTGTEAILHMMRLARASTGRERIVKFIGAYHGSHDGAQLSVRPLDTVTHGWLGVPESEGIPAAESEYTLAVPYNDIDALADCLNTFPGEVAAIIVDCAMNNSGLAAPDEGFLQAVERLAREHGALLVLDEVVTGFRYGLGGAAAHYGLSPDLAAFGKVLGGGAPIGALVGRAEHMRKLDIDDHGRCPVPQSGTFAANPVTLASAKALLTHLQANRSVYETLDRMGGRIRDAVNLLGDQRRLPLIATGVGSMFQIHAGVPEMRDYDDFRSRDADFRARLYLHMAIHGCYLPTPTGTFFLSASHTDADVERFLELFELFLQDHVES